MEGRVVECVLKEPKTGLIRALTWLIAKLYGIAGFGEVSRSFFEQKPVPKGSLNLLRTN